MISSIKLFIMYLRQICNFAFRSLCFDHLGMNSLSQKQSSLPVFVCAYSSSLFTITIRTQSLYAIEKDRKQNNLSSAANQMVLLICTALAAAGKHTVHPQNSAGLCRCPIGVCLHLRVKYWPTKSKAAFFQHVHFSWLLSQAV